MIVLFRSLFRSMRMSNENSLFLYSQRVLVDFLPLIMVLSRKLRVKRQDTRMLHFMDITQTCYTKWKHVSCPEKVVLDSKHVGC